MLGVDELERLIHLLCTAQLPPGTEFDENSGFFEAGLTSKALTTVMVELRERGIPVTLLDFFRHHNVAALTAELSGRHG